MAAGVEATTHTAMGRGAEEVDASMTGAVEEASQWESGDEGRHHLHRSETLTGVVVVVVGEEEEEEGAVGMISDGSIKEHGHDNRPSGYAESGAFGTARSEAARHPYHNLDKRYSRVLAREKQA